MHPLHSLTLAELHQRELRADAARARLVAEATRARRQRSRYDWLRRLARGRPRFARTPSAVPAAIRG